MHAKAPLAGLQSLGAREVSTSDPKTAKGNFTLMLQCSRLVGVRCSMSVARVGLGDNCASQCTVPSNKEFPLENAVSGGYAGIT